MLTTVLLLTGVAAVIAGCALISTSLALIVGGSLALVIGVAHGRGSA